MATRCAFQLCQNKAAGLVRVKVLDISNRSAIREVPSCRKCADIMETAFEERVPIHLTQEGVLYLGDLDQQLPRRA